MKALSMKALWWRAEGDANKYTILSGEGERPDWVASILLNGEFHTKDQEQMMNWIVSALSCKTEDAPVTVEEIVVRHLSENGYDGLYNCDAECACEKEELAPCSNIGLECKVGIKQEGCTCGEGCEWHIVSPLVL